MGKAKYTRLQEIQETIRAGEESCEGVVQYYLSRIEASRSLNAYVEVYAGEALSRLNGWTVDGRRCTVYGLARGLFGGRCTRLR